MTGSIRVEGIKRNMDYKEIKLLKQSNKSTVHLIQEQNGETLYIRKELQGRHPVYLELQEFTHPYLPKLYEVVLSDDSTIVIEEYIEGKTLGSEELSEKQFLNIVQELCSVLELLHARGIIHRDIKPSNILLAKDGHIRLIDFDAARMPKEEKEQDTIRLGTRGYAPPEQYGFSQTDERADIYALGITLEQILGGKVCKTRYKKILAKCTSLDPNKRYQSVRQVECAFTGTRRNIICAAVALLLIITGSAVLWKTASEKPVQSENTELIVLPSPEDPHWDADTGIALWRNVPESGVGSEVQYDWRLYRCDTPTPPDLDKSEWGVESSMRGDGVGDFFNLHLACEFWDNGYYYFAVRAAGDGVTYTDSPYVLSDVFEYTGADAPRLPYPEDLSWILKEVEDTRLYFASFSNWDDYEDNDTIQVFVYDEEGDWVNSNYFYKKDLVERNWPGILIPAEYVNQRGKSYHFAFQVTSSRPNEYRATPEVFPWPVEEQYLSPWLENGS